jgi:peptide deformylase
MLKIAKYPAEILRKNAKPISEFNDDLKKLAEDMAKIMYEDDGIGLAGPQVSLSKNIIIIGDSDEHSWKAYINPIITYISKNTTTTEEGCLSLPNIFGNVTRPKKIRFKYQDLDGKTHKTKAKGLDAIVIQHEVDHLNGVLFIDRADKITKGQDILDSLKNNGDNK